MHLGAADQSGTIRGKMMKNRNGLCDMAVAFRIARVAVGQDAVGAVITAPSPTAGTDSPLAQTRASSAQAPHRARAARRALPRSDSPGRPAGAPPGRLLSLARP